MPRSEPPRDDVEREIVRRAYVSMFEGDEYIRPREFRVECGWDDATLDRALEDLEGLLRFRDSAPSYVLTPAGVLRAESMELPSGELVSLNKRARERIIAAYGAGAEREGKDATHHWGAIAEQAARETGAGLQLVVANHDFLVALCYLTHPSSLGWYRLSPVGLNAYHEWRRHSAQLERFRALQDMKAQPCVIR